MDDYVPILPFAITDAEAYGIMLNRFEDEGEVFYNPSIEYYLKSSEEVKHNMIICTEIYDENPRRAVLLASRAAEQTTDNYIEDIMLFDDNGEELEIDFTLSDVLNEVKFIPLEPASITWAKFFFITVHKVENEDGTLVYNPAMNFVVSTYPEVDHAVTIVTTIFEENLDEAIKEAIISGVRLAPAYKDVIVILGAPGDQTVQHTKTVTDYFDELGLPIPEKPKYLH